jgi:cytochrome c oxidase cbb3-type subunit 1
MATTGNPIRQATTGELTGIALAAVTFLGLLLIAAKTDHGAYAFHAAVGMAAALATIFLIGNRCFKPGTGPAPQEIDGKPNYNMAPVKFAPSRRCSGASPASRSG